MAGRNVGVVIMICAFPAIAGAQARARPPRESVQPLTRPRPAGSAPVHFALAPAGNTASFTVREQLMTLQSPSNAVGTTHAISGGITLLPTGKVDPSQSRITVDLSALVTDKENRDRWIKSHTLRTDSFPNAVIAIRDLAGLPATLPTSGTLALRLLGDLTLHGVTRPTTWNVTLTANGDDYTGTATTNIRFEDFGMEQPRLMIVVSVVDNVQLQYDFHFVRTGIN